jgi:predicted DNA-binding transcriptional regulator YafY
MESSKAIWIDYTNWRGERGIRKIIPQALEWKSTSYHPNPQWLMRAFDCDKGAIREFAMADIHRISRELIVDASAEDRNR